MKSLNQISTPASTTKTKAKIIKFLLNSIAKKREKPKERRVNINKTIPESDPANAKPADCIGAIKANENTKLHVRAIRKMKLLS